MKIHEENIIQIKTMRENLRSLREANNWSIKDLSQISGIDTQLLMGIEGEADFQIDLLLTLCRIYSIKPAKIFIPI